jgi:hypothetical protein
MKKVLFAFLMISPIIVLCQSVDSVQRKINSSKNVSRETIILKDTSLYHFIWEGLILGENNMVLSKSDVSVFSDTTLIQKRTSNKFGRCIMSIPMNTNVKLVISKPGYVSKVLSINTTIPVKSVSDYSLSYSVVLFKYQKGVDVDTLKTPIAYIAYNSQKNVFYYDIKKVKRINELISKRYDEYNKSLKNTSKK